MPESMPQFDFSKQERKNDENKYEGVKKNVDGTSDYSKAAVFRPDEQESQHNKDSDIEIEKKPEKLFRAFSMHPDELSVEKFNETLTPQNVNKDDSTKVSDGNELGVYMSDNEQMVKSAYAHNGGNVRGLNIEVPRYNSECGIAKSIELPSCGAILEIDTNDVSIRKPEIIEALEGVYNNGFGGDEWIADSISAEKYRVKKLTLSIGPHMPEFAVDVDYSSENGLQEAIDFIKEKFNQKKQEAGEFKDFLKSLNEQDRMRPYIWIKKEWSKYKMEIDLANQFDRGEEPMFRDISEQFLREYLSLSEENFDRIEKLNYKELSGAYKKQYESFADERMDNITVAVVPDDLWMKSQPTESNALNHVILMKESYYNKKESTDEMAWLTHELAHYQFLINLDDVDKYEQNMQELAFDDIGSEYTYPNNIVEKATFEKQFQYLKKEGRTRDDVMLLIMQYYEIDDMKFFNKILDKVYSD